MQDEFNDDFFNISQCISAERLNGYRRDGFTSLEVYAWNIELSEALYPLLHLIEISLRNRLHRAISIILDDDAWLLNENHLVREKLEPYWLEQIDGCIAEARKQNMLSSSEGYIVSELNFGFWTSLLSQAFEYGNFLWPKLKNKVFPKANGINMSNIRSRFSQIRKLRNKVFHYSPICHKGNLAVLHDQMIEAITWMEPSLLKLVQIDRFPSIYAKGPDVTK